MLFFRLAESLSPRFLHPVFLGSKIKVIVCPQCGSGNIALDPSGIHSNLCNSCHHAFGSSAIIENINNSEETRLKRTTD